MKMLKLETKKCSCCGLEHPVATMAIEEDNVYKGIKVTYEAVYEFCGVEDKMHADGDMASQNYNAMVEGYRKTTGQVNLPTAKAEGLTAAQIKASEQSAKNV